MYEPDKWMVIEVIHNNEKFYRVFATWSGSYLEGQSWRMSTKIQSVEENGDYLLFHNESGSVYKCHKEMYGVCGYGASVLSEIIDKAEGHTITVLPEDTDWMNWESFFVPSCRSVPK